jgi:RpiR family carbohydrate utilization transcriptional regulator
LQHRIAALQGRLSPAERKVAALVAADPASVVAGNLASVARAAGVSEPTVIRFCRSVGLEGFSDLRLALARLEGAAANPSLPPGPGAPDAPAGAINAAIAALSTLRRALDPGQLEHASRLLLGAEQVEIWACDATAPIALALARSLRGLCGVLAVRTTARDQAVALAGCEAGTVVFGVWAEREPRALSAAAAAGLRIVALAGSAPAATVNALLRCDAPAAGAAGAVAHRIALLALGETLCLATLRAAPPAARDRAVRMAAAERG